MFLFRKSANSVKCLSEFHTSDVLAVFTLTFFSLISSQPYSIDWHLGPVTLSSLFWTLMLSAALYPAGLYHVLYHLKSMYSCILRSFPIRQEYA